jgi:hypothetical protein
MRLFYNEIYMKKVFILLSFWSALQVQAQTLFDESRVNSVYIKIDEDDLKKIYDDVQADTYYKADFVYAMANQSDTVREVGFRLRGNTSRTGAKKSFKVDFNQYKQGGKYKEVKKIDLNSSRNDPTLIRERLFYYGWKKANLPERRSCFVKVYINNRYYGTYTMMEEFDKDWCKRAFGNNGGNLYKCRYPADLAYLGTDPKKYKDIKHSATERAYDLKTNELADDYSDLIGLCSALNQPLDAQFGTNIEKVLNVRGFLKALAYEVLTGHWDDYAYNKNNFYLYKNNKTGKFEFLSYDADNTFGIDWVGKDWATRNINTWEAKSPEKRPLVTKLLGVYEYSQLYNRYIDTISTKVLATDSIFPVITKLSNQIRPFVASDPYYPLDYGYNLQKFGDGLNKSIDGHTPYGIRPFLSLRLQNAKNQLILNQNEATENDVKVSVAPNPTSDLLIFGTEFTEAATIDCFDVTGQLVLRESLPSLQGSVLSIAHLPQGIYQLVVKDAKQHIINQLKVIKQ